MCVIKNTRRAREFSFVNITIITQKFKKFLYLLSLIIIYRNVSLLRDSIILNREEESSSHSLNAFLNAFLLIVSRRERRYSSRCPATFVVQSVDDREEKKKKKREEKRRTHEFVARTHDDDRKPIRKRRRGVERGEKRITRPKFTLLTTFSTKGEGDLLCPLFPPPFVSFEKEKQEENWERERKRQRETKRWKEGGEGGEGGGRKDARIFSPPSSFPLSLPSSLYKQASLLSISFSRIAPSILRSLEPSTVIPQARRVGSRVAGWPPKEKGTGVNGVVS